MFQSEFSGVGFLFMLFSQAPEGRNFTKTWSFLRNVFAQHVAPLLAMRVSEIAPAVLERSRRRGGALSQRLETRIVA